MLRDAGFACPKGLHLIAPTLSGEALLPHELKEGNGCAFWVDPGELAELLRKSGKSGTVRMKAYFEDSLGKRHYSVCVRAKPWLTTRVEVSGFVKPRRSG